jgi:hypothetical protein
MSYSALIDQFGAKPTSMPASTVADLAGKQAKDIYFRTAGEARERLVFEPRKAIPVVMGRALFNSGLA